MRSQRKLNPFQRGILQKVATLIVYCFSFLGMAYIIKIFEKYRFNTIAGEVVQQSMLTVESFQSLKASIDIMDPTSLYGILFIGFCWLGVGWLAMRWTAKLNWAWPVTLPKVVEFRDAMLKLGVVEPLERVEFIRKHKLRVFIALSPLLEGHQTNVRARLYPFAGHSALSDVEVFALHTGKQTLCLDAHDYERLILEGKQRTSLEEAVVLTKKNNEIEELKTKIAFLNTKNGQLEKGAATLTAENDALKNLVRVRPAQEESRVDRLRMERLHWAVLNPLIDRLLEDAKPGQKYTEKELRTAYEAELLTRSNLQMQMQALLENKKKSPKDLGPSGSLWEAVKAELKSAGKMNLGGAPKKNP